MTGSAKRCEHCKKDFTGRGGRAKFCTAKCCNRAFEARRTARRREEAKGWKPIPCLWCKKPGRIGPRGPSRYCSDQCRVNMSHKNRMLRARGGVKLCDWCEEPLSDTRGGKTTCGDVCFREIRCLQFRKYGAKKRKIEEERKRLASYGGKGSRAERREINERNKGLFAAKLVRRLLRGD